MAQDFQAVFKSEGDNVDYTPSGSVDAGEVILLGSNLVTIATSDIAANALGSVRVSGIVDMVIKSESFTLGVALFWDETGDPYNGSAGSGALTKTGAAGPFAGWALEAATGGTDEKISMLLRSVSDASAESIGLVDLNDITGAVTYVSGTLLVGDGNSMESVEPSGAFTMIADGTALINPDTDLGSSGTAGTLDVFAATATSGKFILSCDDQDADTNVTLKPSPMAQASVISIPDPGAATANVMLTDAVNDQVRVTSTAVELSQLAGAVLADMTPGSGITGAAAAAGGNVMKIGPMFKTEIFIDLTDLTSAAIGEIIGEVGQANCHIGQITAAKNGTIVYGQITCIETPVGGDPDVDFYGSATEATGTQATGIAGLTGEAKLLDNGDWTGAPQTPIAMTALPGAGGYLYMVDGGGTAVIYTAGQFLLEFWGV